MRNLQKNALILKKIERNRRGRRKVAERRRNRPSKRQWSQQAHRIQSGLMNKTMTFSTNNQVRKRKKRASHRSVPRRKKRKLLLRRSHANRSVSELTARRRRLLGGLQNLPRKTMWKEPRQSPPCASKRRDVSARHRRMTKARTSRSLAKSQRRR